MMWPLIVKDPLTGWWLWPFSHKARMIRQAHVIYRQTLNAMVEAAAL